MAGNFKQQPGATASQSNMITQTKTRIFSFTPHRQETGKPASGKDQFYPQLNGLRFLFIFMVMLHHWGPQTFFEQYRIGWVGVDLFYVLSGFLIGEILLKEKETSESKSLSIRNFIIRRALRIFPLYYAAVLLYALFVDDGGILIFNLTYTNNIFQAFHMENVKEDFWHLWSLCVEEQFYLLFPFLIFFTKKKYLLPILLSGIGFSIAGRLFATYAANLANLHIMMPFCLDSLLGGVLLAYLKLHRPEVLLRFLGGQAKALTIVASSGVALILVCYANNDLLLFGTLRLFGSVAGFFLIGYSVMRRYKGPLKAFLENRIVAEFGKISYGLYLIHSFVERIYYRHAEGNAIRKFFIESDLPFIRNRYVIDFILLFGITAAIAYVSFYFFEKRFLKLKTLFT